MLTANQCSLPRAEVVLATFTSPPLFEWIVPATGRIALDSGAGAEDVGCLRAAGERYGDRLARSWLKVNALVSARKAIRGVVAFIAMHTSGRAVRLP
jgi:hypothetical protein